MFRFSLLSTAIAILAFASAPRAAAQAFATPQDTPFSALHQTPAVATGDMNHDGRVDWVFINSDPAGTVDITVVLGNGSGGMLSSASAVSAVVINPIALDLADINNDGNLDAVTVSNAPSVRTIFFGDGLGGFSSNTNANLAGANFLDVKIADMNNDGNKDLITLNSTPELRVAFGDGAGGFPVVNTYGAIIGATHIAVADINNDNLPDTMVINIGNVAVRLNMGGGVLGAPNVFAVAGPDAIALGDLNNDNNLDIATVDNAINGIIVAFGDGAGAFLFPAAFPTSPGPVDVGIADIDNDNNRDICVTCANGAVRVDDFFRGRGTGNLLTPVQIPLSRLPGAIVLRDMNGDMKIDVTVTHNNSPGGYTTVLSLGMPQFAPIANYPTVGASPRGVALGDLNADGAIDWVSTNAGNDTITVRLGAAGGLFGAATGYASPVDPRAVVLADANLDGFLDAVICCNASNRVSCFKGVGNGTFGARLDTAVAGNPEDVIVADMNLDGFPDAVAAAMAANVVSIAHGNATGNFGIGGLQNVAVGAQPVAVISRDFNFDGRPDLATANMAGNSVSALTQQPAGSFNVNNFPTVGNAPMDLASEDMNADGFLDIVTADSATNNYSRLPGMVGGFGAGTAVAVTGQFPRSVALPDLNGDGLPDVVVANEVSSNCTINLNGALRTTGFDVGDQPRGVASADLNQDGIADLVFVNENSGIVSVFVSSSPLAGGMTQFGTGTSGCDGVLAMGAASAPRVNDPKFGLICTNAPKNSLGLLLVANVPDVLGSDPFALGAEIHVNVFLSTELYGYNFYSVNEGATFAPVPIPNNPFLAGATYHSQAVWVEDPQRGCSPALLSIVTSRGLTFTIKM